MEAVGIIAEYNPFHNGHLYQLRQVKQRFPHSVIVVAMSGNYLQRGEPACLDKWVRAQIALLNGADVIVELPVRASVQPADVFAQWGVRILANLGVSILAFGAEHAGYDFASLATQTAAVQGDFTVHDQSYAATYQQAIAAKVGYPIDQPNDVLGLAYAKANQKLAHPLRLAPIQRHNAAYLDADLAAGSIASATAIRRAWQNGKYTDVCRYVPRETARALRHGAFVNWKQLWPGLRQRLVTVSPVQLRLIVGMTEGIEYRLIRLAQELPPSTSFETWLHAVKSKRFTYTRLARLAMNVALGITANEVTTFTAHPYTHLLGFTTQGQQYLRWAKHHYAFPVLTKINQKDKNGFYAPDYRAGVLYQLAAGGQEQDLKRAPVRVTREDDNGSTVVIK
ncbi:nucleotidyltransferase [Ligilactobacillus sp. LYQ139]|uniref:nucleotidyltransferase n=1 Tax=Ligilactobacillus sp. LYQ139 TaxID=3378800 RepID=UPI0038547379